LLYIVEIIKGTTPMKTTTQPINSIMKTNKKTFGQYLVEVTGDKVSIVGNHNSNFGHFYPTNFERFKAHPKGEQYDWNRPQVLGMEWEYGLTGSIRAWLYNLVLNDKISA
jgi:hypothetical protein